MKLSKFQVHRHRFRVYLLQINSVLEKTMII